MTDITDKARSAVYAALDELNEQLPAEHRLKKTPETVLLGKTGTLDSVNFISLMVLVEEKCQDEWGVSVSLFGSPDDNPEPGADDSFQTVGSFIQYLSRRMDAGIS